MLVICHYLFWFYHYLVLDCHDAFHMHHVWVTKLKIYLCIAGGEKREPAKAQLHNRSHMVLEVEAAKKARTATVNHVSSYTMTQHKRKGGKALMTLGMAAARALSGPCAPLSIFNSQLNPESRCSFCCSHVWLFRNSPGGARSVFPALWNEICGFFFPFHKSCLQLNIRFRLVLSMD